MTTKTIQMYRTNLDGSETTLYPLTEAKYVTMDDGTTIEEALTNSDSSKYSPVIESSKAMFKVGEGDSVDLSESAIDGAYNSCVLKGKTMVNCIQEPSSQDVVLPYEFEDGQYVTINDTKESGVLGVELKGQTLVNLIKFKSCASFISYNNGTAIFTNPTGAGNLSFSVMFKPSTKYIFKANFKCDGDWNTTIRMDLFPDTFEEFKGVTPTPTPTNYYFTFTTPSDISTLESFRIYVPTSGNGIATISNIMILEYQQGMENWDIPYFEGMASCKMPILKSVGKNLLPLGNSQDLSTRGLIVTQKDGKLLINGVTTGITDYRVFNVNNNVEQMKKFNSLPVGTTITLSNNLGKECYFNVIRNGSSIYLKNTITIEDGDKDINAFIRFNTNETHDNTELYVQIEYGAVATAYEPYKSSILSCNEDIELRGIGDVRDTLDCLTGKMISNFDEIILTGDEEVSNWATSGAFFIKTSKSNQHQDNGRILCLSDKIPSSTINAIYRDTDGIGVMDGKFVIRITGLTTSEEVSNWLKQNAPIRVLYVTKEKSIKTVDFSIVDQNGNTIPTLKSWNTTTHIYSEIPENTLYPILSHSNPTYPVILKPSTKYSIVANSYSNDHTNSAINFNLGGATASTTVGNRVTTITTPSTLSNELLTMSGRGNKLNNVMVIEGDVVGDEPYFEGICDCKTPILSNVGKNLFDVDYFVREVNNQNVCYKNEEGSLVVKGSYHSVKINIPYPTTITYLQTSTNTANNGASIFEAQHPDGTSTHIGVGINTTLERKTWSIKKPIIAIGFNNWAGGENILKDIMLFKAEDSTTYEPYKSNILSCETYFDEATQSDKTIVLRSLPSGVCDTLNVETGEYVQRIGEVTKNNSTGFSLSTGGWENKSNVCTFEYFNPEGMKVQNANNKPTLNCDKVPSNTFADQWGNTEGIESITQHSIGGIVLSITRDKLLTQDVDGLNTYLQSNPLTIQYELETPIVTTIDVQGFPYAYKDGHVQLSSGSIEQSLTPKVEYSLVANRNGQIEANTKSIRRHQDKLDDFEALMLTQMIQTHYEKTLLQFDFEMQMMALGGE